MSETTAPPALSERWHVHTGTVQLFIVGPGSDAWLACSAPDYSHGRPGTEQEWNLARRAVTILERRYGAYRYAGPQEIARALRDAARSGPLPEPEPETPAVSNVDTEPAAPAIPFEDILQLVSGATGVPVEDLLDARGTRHNSRTRPAIHARYMAYAILRDRHRIGYAVLAERFGRHRSSMSQALIAHDSRMRSSASYSRAYRQLFRQAKTLTSALA